MENLRKFEFGNAELIFGGELLHTDVIIDDVYHRDYYDSDLGLIFYMDEN